jgi:hypothetical protein
LTPGIDQFEDGRFRIGENIVANMARKANSDSAIAVLSP